MDLSQGIGARAGKRVSSEMADRTPRQQLPDWLVVSPFSWYWGLSLCPWAVWKMAQFFLYHHLFFSVCGSRAVVHIQVKDINEFAPAFKEPSYKAVVTEGKIYDSILQVEAVDEDCSPQYSQICNYEIVTTDVPFAIDRNGECPEKTPVGAGKHPPF